MLGGLRSRRRHGDGALRRVAAKNISSDAPEAGSAGGFGLALDFGFRRKPFVITTNFNVAELCLDFLMGVLDRIPDSHNLPDASQDGSRHLNYRLHDQISFTAEARAFHIR